MITLSIVKNEVSYSLELLTPLLELGDWEYRKNCVRELSLNFDLRMRDFLLGTGRDKSHHIYFKKEYIGKGETLAVSVEYDLVSTVSENFESLDDVIQKHVKALEIVLGKADFSPRVQAVSYNAHAHVDGEKLNSYLDKLMSFRPQLPGKMTGRGSIFVFEGPTNNSSVQVTTGDSQLIPGSLYLSIWFSFGGDTDSYQDLFRICEDFSRKHIFPSFEIEINELGAE